MKIEKERNSIRITYSACAPLTRITEMYDSIAARVAGIYLPSDVQHGKEGITLNIRHRESLQAYFEKNIFRIDDYIEVLKRLKAIIKALKENGFEPDNCLWDVDAVFVGGSVAELETVYLAEPEASELENNSLTDFLAVMSLHVFDSRDSAIEALSDAVSEFAQAERTGDNDSPGDEQFDRAIEILDNFSSGAGRVRRLIYCFWNRVKKAVNGFFAKADQQETGDKLPVDFADENAPSEKRLFLNDGAGSPYFEYIAAEANDDKKNSNGIYGLESRLTNLDPAEVVSTEPAKSSDSVNRKIMRETYPIGREYLIRRAGIYCPYVSRQHAELIREGGEYILTDLESLNGTYLNGDRLIPGSFYRVVKGDVISLAHIGMSFAFCV